MGLLPGKKAQTISTWDTVVQCTAFELQIAIGDMRFEVKAFEGPLPGRGYDALIGRDVLSQCVLVYDGSSNSFTLSQAITD